MRRELILQFPKVNEQQFKREKTIRQSEELQIILQELREKKSNFLYNIKNAQILKESRINPKKRKKHLILKTQPKSDLLQKIHRTEVVEQEKQQSDFLKRQTVKQLVNLFQIRNCLFLAHQHTKGVTQKQINTPKYQSLQKSKQKKDRQFNNVSSQVLFKSPKNSKMLQISDQTPKSKNKFKGFSNHYRQCLNISHLQCEVSPKNSQIKRRMKHLNILHNSQKQISMPPLHKTFMIQGWSSQASQMLPYIT